MLSGPARCTTTCGQGCREAAHVLVPIPRVLGQATHSDLLEIGRDIGPLSGGRFHFLVDMGKHDLNWLVAFKGRPPTKQVVGHGPQSIDVDPCSWHLIGDLYNTTAPDSRNGPILRIPRGGLILF